MRHRLASLLIAAAAPLAISACGEKQENTTATTSSSLTKQQFVSEANRICQQTDDKIERASKRFFADAPASEKPPPREIAQFAQSTAFPAIEDEISRIEALGAPAGDED